MFLDSTFKNISFPNIFERIAPTFKMLYVISRNRTRRDISERFFIFFVSHLFQQLKFISQVLASLKQNKCQDFKGLDQTHLKFHGGQFIENIISHLFTDGTPRDLIIGLSGRFDRVTRHVVESDDVG